MPPLDMTKDAKPNLPEDCTDDCGLLNLHHVDQQSNRLQNMQGSVYAPRRHGAPPAHPHPRGKASPRCLPMDPSLVRHPCRLLRLMLRLAAARSQRSMVANNPTAK